MKKMVVLNWVSIDGFIADANGRIDFISQAPEIDKASHERIHADTMLIGRVTYQGLEAFWPKVAADAKSPPDLKKMAGEVLRMTKVVASKSLKEVTMENSQLLKSGLIEGAKKLKQGAGGDIMVIGSGQLIPLLADAGLIDEYLLAVTPVVLGSGRPQFKGAQQLKLKLTEAVNYPSGAVLLHYET